MGDKIKDLSKPYKGGVRIKGGAHIDMPIVKTLGGELSYGIPDGFDASMKTGFSRSGFGTTIDTESGDVTTTFPGPGGITYGSVSEKKKDDTRKVGFGLAGRLGKRVGLKAGIESWGNGDVAFPGEFGTTKIAPGLYTRSQRLGTKDQFGFPQVQIDSYAELANGKKVRIRRDKVSVPSQNIDDILHGDVDRKGPGSVPTKDVVEAFNRALEEDPNLFAGTPAISRNAFDTERSSTGERVGFPIPGTARDGIVLALMTKAKSLAGQPHAGETIAKILWAMRAGRVAP